jgi:leucyl-tRNA synthetase
MMTFVNEATGKDPLPRPIVETFLHVLCPYAPHLAEELWARLGHSDLLSLRPWPSFDPALCVDDTVTIVLQVNGKKRDQLSMPRDASKEEIEKAALASEKVAQFLGDREPRKVIVVPGRLVNVVG